MATLINGDGNAAVYAAQDADWFAGVEGNVTKILNIGLKMAYEIEDANTIAVKNGVIVTKEGRRIQVDAGSIDEFTIPTGAQGVTKYYIIGYHLYTDSSSNQLCETFVQLMANNTDTIPEDTFRGGSDEVYVSLYRVTQDGITLSTVQSLLPEAATIKDIEDDISGINASLTELGTPTLLADFSNTTASYVTLSDYIIRYRYLLLIQTNTINSAFYATSMLPVSLFKVSGAILRASSSSVAGNVQHNWMVQITYNNDITVSALAKSDISTEPARGLLYGIK